MVEYQVRFTVARCTTRSLLSAAISAISGNLVDR